MALPLTAVSPGCWLVPQAQLREWEAAEAQKKALAREIALKLKEDRAAQLADRDLVSRGSRKRLQHTCTQLPTAQRPC